MTMILVLLFIAAIVGIFKPYIKNSKRWHFAAAAFAFFVGIGVTAPETDEKTGDEVAERQEAKTTTEKQAKSNEPTKAVIAAVIALQSSIMDGMKPCDNAGSKLAEMASGLAAGKNSIYDGYSAAKRTEDSCRDSWRTISNLEVPDALEDEAKEKATKTIEICENAAIAKQMGAEKMAEIFDGNMRPSTVDEATKLSNSAQAGVLACVASIFDVAIAANVDISELNSE